MINYIFYLNSGVEGKNIDEWHGKNGYDDKEEEYVEGRGKN